MTEPKSTALSAEEMRQRHALRGSTAPPGTSPKPVAWQQEYLQAVRERNSLVTENHALKAEIARLREAFDPIVKARLRLVHPTSREWETAIAEFMVPPRDGS